MEIAVVIAHAMLFLSHQQVEELGAILVVVQVHLAVQEVPEVVQEAADQEKIKDHHRR